MPTQYQELIEAYAEYVGLLENAEAALLPFAHVHGYRTSNVNIRRGKELREKIAQLKGEPNPHCELCLGSGSCPECGGMGGEDENCSLCEGDGICPDCHGTGKKEEESK